MKKFKNKTQIMKMSSKELLEYKRELDALYRELVIYCKAFVLTRQSVKAELKEKSNDISNLLKHLEKQASSAENSSELETLLTQSIIH